MIDTAPYYSRKSFDAPELYRVAEWASGVVTRERFDAVAGSGHSGLLLLGAISYKTGVPAIAVRKRGEELDTHSYDRVHCVIPASRSDMLRYAFVDDCVASGRTLLNVVEQVAQSAPNAVLAGILTYSTELSIHDARRLNLGHVPRFHFAARSVGLPCGRRVRLANRGA
jgi:adenine/guanine phosphoribosyltransferase-like PRPP-binding protein